jgi:hypothetical protein
MLASVLMPIFGIVNGLDVFYFGLLRSEAFAFLIGFFTASIYTFFIAFRQQMRLLIRILLILLGLLFLAFIFHSMEGLINDSEFAVKPTVSAGSKIKVGGFLFLSVGYFFGTLVGSGTGNWIKKLQSTNLSDRLSKIIPLITATIISTAGINMFFLRSFTFTLVLTLTGILISIGVSIAAQKSS